MTQNDAEKRLGQLLMTDMPVREIAAVRAAVSKDWFQNYSALRRKFMESLSDSIPQLSLIRLSREEFMNLLRGRELPENWSLRLRVPLMYGGKLEIDNMFMAPTFPYSMNMDRFIAEQSGAGMLFLPNPAKKVYVPLHMLNGGGGGNATDDRLSQMSAQFAADRGMI